jgi:hypothetical protein
MAGRPRPVKGFGGVVSPYRLRRAGCASSAGAAIGGTTDSRYDTDLLLWSEEQALALRAAAREGSNAPIDWEHVAAEIESLGIAESRAPASHIGTVIEHPLKSGGAAGTRLA